jgi:antitoxin (DNA-binding transcriptional repressor) of toxin-antitoxin stability system
MEYINVREFKIHSTKYLNRGREIVVTKHRVPIAFIAPIDPRSMSGTLLQLGQIFKNANISEKSAKRAVAAVRKGLYESR